MIRQISYKPDYSVHTLDNVYVNKMCNVSFRKEGGQFKCISFLMLMFSPFVIVIISHMNTEHTLNYAVRQWQNTEDETKEVRV